VATQPVQQQPEQMAQQPAQPEQPIEREPELMAQAQPPAAPERDETQSMAPAEQTLPRTASPLPLLGLAGLFSLGLAAVARVVNKL
jgi:hypothetical protein